MKTAILAFVIVFLPHSASAAISCEGIYYSADNSIIGKTVKSGMMINEQLILMTGVVPGCTVHM